MSDRSCASNYHPCIWIWSCIVLWNSTSIQLMHCVFENPKVEATPQGATELRDRFLPVIEASERLNNTVLVKMKDYWPVRSCLVCSLVVHSLHQWDATSVIKLPFLSFFSLFFLPIGYNMPFLCPHVTCQLSRVRLCQALSSLNLSGSSSLTPIHNRPHNCQALSGSFQPHSRPLALLS